MSERSPETPSIDLTAAPTRMPSRMWAAIVVAAACALLVPSGGSSAQSPAPQRQSAAVAAPGSAPGSTGVAPARRGGGGTSGQSGKPASGCGSEGAIGVSRVHTIDAGRPGQKFGHQQYHDVDFLADGEVVLTFDDGPLRPYTMPVLKALDAHCTKATFFVVGRMALADPALVRETAQRGHTIGTHTFSHSDARKLGPAKARSELELGFSAVSKALGTPVAPFFRFPYLSAPQSTADYATSRKISVFSIEVDAYDYRSKDPAAVHRTVLAQLQEKRKGILLFHDIQPATAGALKGLLDELKARGFKVVHLASNGPVATLPEFDVMADREMARRGQVVAANPLASRSVVWPVSGPNAPPSEPAGTEYLPWGVQAVRPPPSPPASPPPPRPRRQLDDDSEWSTRVFRY